MTFQPLQESSNNFYSRRNWEKETLDDDLMIAKICISNSDRRVEEAFNNERDEEEKDDREMRVSISLSLGEAQGTWETTPV